MQYETFEDRRVAFGNVEAQAEKAMPYKPTPWQLRHDVIQRLETFALLEAERREKEQAALDKQVAAYEENFVKKGGEALGLANNEEVRASAVLSYALCLVRVLCVCVVLCCVALRCVSVSCCMCVVVLRCRLLLAQRDPEDPDFMNPGAHENKVEEMAEILYAHIRPIRHMLARETHA